MSQIFLFALRNATRRFRHSILTVIIVAIAIATFMVSHLVFSLLHGSVSLSAERLGADIIVLPKAVGVTAEQTLFTAEPVNVYMPSDIEDAVSKVSGVSKVTSQFFTQSLDSSCCDLREAKRLIGYDVNTDFVISPWLPEGESARLDDHHVLIGGIVKPFFGDRAVILENVFEVSGQLQPTGTGMDETVFMNIDIARQLAKESTYLQHYWQNEQPEDLISVIMIETNDRQKSAVVADEINHLGLPVQAITAGEVIGDMKEQMLAVNQILLWIWSILILMASLALFGRFMSLAKERKREIGVMRALGGYRRDSFAVVLVEVLLIVVFGWMIGAGIGSWGASYVLNWVKGTLAVPPASITMLNMLFRGLIGLGIALSIGVCAAVYPAWSSSRLDPQEAIARSQLD